MVFNFTPFTQIFFYEFQSLIELYDQDNNETSYRNIKSV